MLLNEALHTLGQLCSLQLPSKHADYLIPCAEEVDVRLSSWILPRKRR